MMDLISRSRVISVLEQLEEHSLTGKMHISNAIYLLENQPTAYDIDKIVEELESEKRYGSKYDSYYEENLYRGEMFENDVNNKTIDKAIKIVKQGVASDDVCEWKSTSDGEFIQNPHTKRLYSNEPSMQNVYCNTCGKKIKVVE